MKNEQMRAAALRKWNACAKPLGSLGLLEEQVVSLCALQQTLSPSIQKRTAVIFCSDNGVVAEGVTQTGPEVTRLVAKQLALGRSSVNRMASVANADVLPVDIGILPDPSVEMPENIFTAPAGPGTKDIAAGPAMTGEELAAALDTGRAVAEKLIDEGNELLIAGEMGIGNTTTSSAVTAVLLGKDPAEVTGKGAGLSDADLTKKIEVIRKAVAVNTPDPADPLEVLRTLGGFDLAGMCGLYLAAASRGVPVVIDGFPSAAAALLAARIAPDAADAMLASHVSAEPAARMILHELKKEAPIAAGLRLGEGTGGIALLPLLDMALAVFEEAYTFEEGGIEPYVEL